MSEEKALVSIEQKMVEFYGDELVAVRAADGQIYVSVKHICDALGLARRGQVTRINRQPVLEKGYRPGIVTIPPHNQEVQMGMLRVDLVPLFLAGVSVKRIKDKSIQDKLEHYQEQAAKVLWEAFQEGRLTADPAFDELLKQDNDAVEAYKMLQAMIKLARNQILMQSQLDTQQIQLDNHNRRLEMLETQFGDESRTISQDQAVQISQAVKAIAMVWSKQAKDNKYGAVYGRLYQRFSITSYKLLPETRFKEAMNWLTQWYMELTGDDSVPF